MVERGWHTSSTFAAFDAKRASSRSAAIARTARDQAGSSGSSAIGRGLATRKRKTTSVEWSKQFEGLPAHEFAPAADSEGGGFLRGHDVVVVHAH